MSKHIRASGQRYNLKELVYIKIYQRETLVSLFTLFSLLTSLTLFPCH